MTTPPQTPSELDKAVALADKFARKIDRPLHQFSENTQDELVTIAEEAFADAAKRVKELEKENAEMQEKCRYLAIDERQHWTDFERKAVECVGLKIELGTQELKLSTLRIEYKNALEAVSYSFIGHYENAINSLSHLIFIHDNPKSVEAGFGPQETFKFWKEQIPKAKEELAKVQRVLSTPYAIAAMKKGYK